MPSVLYNKLIPCRNLRADVSAGICRGGKAAVKINLGKERRSLADPVGALRHLIADRAEVVVFDGFYFVSSSEYSRFKLFELFCDKALRIRESLLSYVPLGDILGGRTRYLNIITEHAVIAYFQLLDSGLLFFGVLDLGQIRFAVIDYRAKLIKLGTVSGLYHSALAHLKRRCIDYRIVDKLAYVRKLIRICAEGYEFVMIRRAEKSLYIRDHGNRLTYRSKLACARSLVYDSGYKPLEVEHGRKLLRKLLAEHEVFGKRTYRALTAEYFGDRGHGMLYPLTEHSRSRRGIRAIENPKERSAFVLADNRLAKLEITPCR